MSSVRHSGHGSRFLLAIACAAAGVLGACGEFSGPGPQPPEDTVKATLPPGPHLDSLYPIATVGGDEDGQFIWTGECVDQGERRDAQLELDFDPSSDGPGLWGTPQDSTFYFLVAGFLDCTHLSSPTVNQEWRGRYEIERDTVWLQVDSVGLKNFLDTPRYLSVNSVSRDGCWVERASSMLTVNLPDSMFFAEGSDVPLDTLQFPMVLGPAQRAGERPPCEEGG